MFARVEGITDGTSSNPAPLIENRQLVADLLDSHRAARPMAAMA
jgi:hypothetical protein